ncbi:hypothetical protein PAXINDRAFT_18185 [Paxillus involutus ATCC 200175]|uniref:Uncharacterized protein n=1 Tax=Paxillus involutus ATCC 200175 TaxID=664439 RepID=A0A0C9SZJ1_PAXIN|nr:hypothetical protein PAXINDRAFT_18185 [Paxillus involutus ATCC 200175]
MGDNKGKNMDDHGQYHPGTILPVHHTPLSNHKPAMADPNSETVPNCAGPEFKIIQEGLKR